MARSRCSPNLNRRLENQAVLHADGRANIVAMTVERLPSVEVMDLAPGLWIGRLENPGWTEGVDWQQVVTCGCVGTGGERWLPCTRPQRGLHSPCCTSADLRLVNRL